MKKKFNLLTLLMAVGVLMLSQGCSSILNYNIVGSWMLDAIVEGQLRTAAVTFVGDESQGTCTMTTMGELYSGIYSASDEDVDFSFDSQGMTVIVLEGSFEDENRMSGTGFSDWGTGPDPFTWEAVRKDI